MEGIKKVFISDNLSAETFEILRNGGLEVHSKTKMPIPELISALQGFDALIVRSDTKVTAEVISQTQLKAIGRAGVGVDNIDVKAATAKGIVVFNCPEGNTRSAAELTCALMLSLARNIPQAGMSLKGGKWDRKSYAGTEVHGKTLALIGLGRIGREVAVRMQAFGMQVIAYDPIVPAEEFVKCAVRQVQLDELWPAADYISVHVPLIKPTENLLNASTMAKCKKGVYILNVARGGIINESDLLASLNAGHVGGAALDVFVQEPPQDRALLEHPRVVVTPHLGASTAEAQTRVAVEIAEQLLALSRGQPAPGIINAPTLVAGSSGEGAAWLKLMRQLAVIMNALTDDVAVKKLTVTHPDQASAVKRGLPVHAAIGLLRSRAPGLNAVNADATAKAMGVEIVLEPVPVMNGTGDAPSSPAQQSSNQLVLTAAGPDGKPVLRLSGCFASTGDDSSSFLLAVDGAAFFVPVPLTGTLVFSPADAGFPAKDSPDVLFYNSNGRWQVFGYKGSNVPALPAVSIEF